MIRRGILRVWDYDASTERCVSTTRRMKTELLIQVPSYARATRSARVVRAMRVWSVQCGVLSWRMVRAMRGTELAYGAWNVWY
eukprot:3941368-Rhodomonas_salina.1